MPDYIEIRNGDFQAQLRPDRVTELTRASFRGLMRLMRRSSEESQEALDRLGGCLREQAAAAEAAWEYAGEDYARGWRQVTDSRSRKKEVRAALAENRRLLNAVKQAKKARDTVLALLKIYDEESAKYAHYHS